MHLDVHGLLQNLLLKAERLLAGNRWTLSLIAALSIV
jgi:hypothetical protein